jgi:hypothetical protein
MTIASAEEIKAFSGVAEREPPNVMLAIKTVHMRFMALLLSSIRDL